jgi:pimeloyl-ACP methyl ester carboxylesterase
VVLLRPVLHRAALRRLGPGDHPAGAHRRGAGPGPDEATLRASCARVRCPILVVHGDEDDISHPRRGAALAEATGGRLAVLEGGGHIPQARDPVKINLLLREFVESLRGRAA